MNLATLLSFKSTVPPLRGDDAGDELGQLALAVAVHPGDAHDLAAGDGEGYVVEAAVLGGLVEIHNSEIARAPARPIPLLVVGGSQLPADHQIGQLRPGGLVPVQGAHRPAGPENGDPVGDPQHLPHLVADEDDGLVLAFELVDDGEEALHLQVRQGGGGLVQHQQLRAPVQGLEDLHPLLLTHGDVGDHLVQVHVQAVALRQGLDLPAHLVLLDEYAPGVLVSQDDILKHRHGLHQHEVLVDHADAQLHRLGGGVDAYLLPV